jgi:hypothetical protein
VQCLACGGEIEPALLRVGSVRCLDCRATNRVLDAKLVEAKRPRSPVRSLAETFGRRLLR